MAQQNVKGATSKPTAASALKNGGRSDQQVYELFLAVQRACGGRSTGTSEPPSVPADAEYLVIDQGSLTLWPFGWSRGFRSPPAMK